MAHTPSLSEAEKLKHELSHEYKSDPANFQPLMDLIAAFESPEIDYSSPEVKKIIQDMRRSAADEPSIIVAPTLPWQKVVPFDPKPVLAEPVAVAVRKDGDGRMMAPPVVFDAIRTTRFQGDPDIEKVVDQEQFENWGKTISFLPEYTLIVHTIAGVCKVVKWAASVKKRVRVAGFRHSWTDIFASNDDVVIMFLPYDTLVQLPYEDPPHNFKTDLSSIKLVDKVRDRIAPPGHAFCKIMAGTTSEQFRKWCFDNKKYCLPMNVIMVEVTFGGTNAPICHGSGLDTTTLSDIVVEMQYVDAKGILQTVNDPAELRAASGAFGLLGVVISISKITECLFGLLRRLKGSKRLERSKVACVFYKLCT